MIFYDSFGELVDFGPVDQDPFIPQPSEMVPDVNLTRYFVDKEVK
nr:unnamed protein product [uncultured bacterium]